MSNNTVIWLPGYTIPSNNSLIRWHWTKRSKHKKEIEKLLIFHYLNRHPDRLLPEAHKEAVKKRMVITSYRKKLLDKDNLYGGAKLIVDSFKTLGFIYDDSFEWLDLVVGQRKDKKDIGTEVIIFGE